MIKRILPGAILLLSLYLWGCNSNGSSAADSNGNAEVKTPVTAVTVNHQNMQQDVWLNATSTFLNNSVVKSTINGYIIKTSLYPGQQVSAGQVLFVLQTKEASILGNQLPDSLKFSGKITIKAPISGYISQLNHQQGDYVMDGEQLCTIADESSFAFILQLPYGLTKGLNNGKQLEIMLPDGRKISGRVASKMPAVDSVSQTQRYLLKVSPSLQLPQNLIAKVKIVENAVQNAQVLPKEAVLNNEAQSEYWIMKMINDTMAVKVNVKKGIEDSSNVQILSPNFPAGTKILNTGNYGLPDTAFVTLTKSSSQ